MFGKPRRKGFLRCIIQTIRFAAIFERRMQEQFSMLSHIKQGDSMEARTAKQDSRGYYFQWGPLGKKYYYDPKSNKSRNDAKYRSSLDHRAAVAQGRLVNGRNG